MHDTAAGPLSNAVAGGIAIGGLFPRASVPRRRSSNKGTAGLRRSQQRSASVDPCSLLRSFGRTHNYSVRPRVIVYDCLTNVNIERTSNVRVKAA